jgi:hypothetical protein
MPDIGSRRGLACAFGFVIAAATSVAIFIDRVNQGDFRAALFGDLLTTLVALALSVCVARARLRPSAVVWAGAGAMLAIVLVHAAIANAKPVEWLDEAPRQLVNDVTAAVATIGLVLVAASRRLALGGIVMVTAPVASYALTHARWHLDRAPGGFAATVQQCVVAQFVSVALALLLFRAIRRQWSLR